MWKKFLIKPYWWWLVVALVIIIIITSIFAWPIIQRSIRHRQWLKPFLDDADNSLGADSPQAAYQQFWQALQADQRETALAYIIGLRRPYYQQVWQDSSRWAIDQTLPSETVLSFQADCLPEAIACRQRAILTYSVAKTSGWLELYQNLAGRWQIGDIY